ncbi:MAG: hypothetical protein AAF961_06355 [Planctomycetota bacterium]
MHKGIEMSGAAWDLLTFWVAVVQFGMAPPLVGPAIVVDLSTARYQVDQYRASNAVGKSELR